MPPAATGKRARDATGPQAPPAFWKDLKTRRTDSGVFDCKRSPHFPEFLRYMKGQMGDASFVEWLGFGVECPEADVKTFTDWVAFFHPMSDASVKASDSASATDVHVDISSCVVPLAGIENMKALISIPGAAKHVDLGGMNLFGASDLFTLVDQSGSMSDANDMLKQGLISMSDKAKDEYDRAPSGSVVQHFAYGVFGSAADSPKASGGNLDTPGGYTPWMPLHEMKAAMRNVAQTSIGSNRGSTNLMAGIEMAIAHLTKRRDDEDLPCNYLQNIVIMTDGHPDHDQRHLLEKRLTDLIGNLSIVVHVLCLGSNADSALAGKLAATTHGMMGHADRAESLGDAFESILAPLRSSSKSFNVELKDKGGRTRVEHYGVLTLTNNTALTSFNFTSKSSSGNHIAATAGLQGQTSTAIVPYYASGDDDPAWKDSRAAIPKALTDAVAAERLLEEHKRQIEEEADRNGMEAALNLSSTLTATYVTNGMAPVPLARVNAFHAELDRTISQQTTVAASFGGAMPSLGRSMTVAAVASRSSYSQA